MSSSECFQCFESQNIGDHHPDDLWIADVTPFTVLLGPPTVVNYFCWFAVFNITKKKRKIFFQSLKTFLRPQNMSIINNPVLLDIADYFLLVCAVSLSIWTGDDAAKAVSYGVDGILVSNHGARQLDGVPATVGSIYLSLPSASHYKSYVN